MAKRNNDILNLQDVLKGFVTENKLETGLDKVQVRDAWAKLMGNGINNYTSDIQKFKLKNDIPGFYVENTTNEVFSLSYIIDMGKFSDKEFKKQ